MMPPLGVFAWRLQAAQLEYCDIASAMIGADFCCFGHFLLTYDITTHKNSQLASWQLRCHKVHPFMCLENKPEFRSSQRVFSHF